MKRLFMVTGQPGIGKTTVVLKTVEALRKSGFAVGGMISREAREKGNRIGFEVVDLETGKRGWLAHVNQAEGPRVGKYRVNLEDLDSVGANSIKNAAVKAQLIVVDEIGPMELHSSAFKESVIQAVNSNKPLLGVIHHTTRDSLIDSITNREDLEIIRVTSESREDLHKFLISKINQILKQR